MAQIILNLKNKLKDVEMSIITMRNCIVKILVVVQGNLHLKICMHNFADPRLCNSQVLVLVDGEHALLIRFSPRFV